MAIVLCQGDPVAVAGIVGGLALGYYLGSKLRHIDAYAPGLCAILSAIFGSFLLRLVLSALLLCAIIAGPPLLLWYCRDIIRRFATSFGRDYPVPDCQSLRRPARSLSTQD